VDTDEFAPTASAPAPGDPRDAGPRPPPTWRDAGWGLLAGGLVGLTAVQFVGLAIGLTRLEARPSGGGLFLGFLITVVWLLTIYWLAMGAWRRSVWGCPFQHVAAAPEVRRCPRHATVAPTTPADDGVHAPGAPGDGHRG
jgi:hypothetical protein